MRFAHGGEAAVEGVQILVPSQGAGECGHEGCDAQARSAAIDVTFAMALGRVVGAGCKPCKECGLLARHGAEFGHADEEGECGDLGDAWNGEEQIEAARQIIVLAQTLLEELELTAVRGLETLDVGGDALEDALVLEALARGLEPGDALGELIDEGQRLGERFDPGIGLGSRRGQCQAAARY
ncbi:hypothetical protein BH10PSE7_BH10PSE7_34890 [soil metagenome]